MRISEKLMLTKFEKGALTLLVKVAGNEGHVESVLFAQFSWNMLKTQGI